MGTAEATASLLPHLPRNSASNSMAKRRRARPTATRVCSLALLVELWLEVLCVCRPIHPIKVLSNCGRTIPFFLALILSHADDSDSSEDEQRHQSVGVPVPHVQGQNHSQGGQYSNGSAFQPVNGHSPAALPNETASGLSVSSSDKESVQEVREK